MKVVINFLIFLCLFVSPSFGSDIQISASVDMTVIAINQTFTYTVEISGEKANSVNNNPKLPDFDKFATYMGSSGTSQNIQIINGKMSVTKSMNFTYMANKVGKFHIEAVELEYKGKVYRGKPIAIEVVAQTGQAKTGSTKKSSKTSSRNQDSLEDNLFLKVNVNKKRVYVNEPVILIYKIYTSVTVTSYSVSKLPNTTGFWAEEFPMGNQPKTYNEIYKGQKFTVAEIKKTALFPTDPGKKTITPMQIECDVRIQNQRRRSIFDSFFDDPFFGRSVRQAINSPPIKIEVLPLPEQGKPAAFSGAVGTFSITAKIDKNHVKTNEAVALKVKIAGTGNIKVLPSPKIEISADFEQYEPKVTQSINRAGNTISGNKTFEYVLIPRFPGMQKIKPIEFTYFDIRSKSYKILSTPEININVEKGSDDFIAIGSGLSKEEVKLLGKDIRFIRKHKPEFRKIGRYFYKNPLFLVLIIFPLILVGASVVYSRHLEKLSANVAYARSRRANQIALSRLKKAQKLLSEKTQKEFYAETSNALLGFLGDKLNIAAAGIITDQVEDMMKARNIDARIIALYLKCLHLCDFKRFAPSESSLNEMKKFYEGAKKAIVVLEKVF